MQTYRRLKWVHQLAPRIYNAYPIFDWKTKDIWIANGRFGWDYNHLYDLFYQAGVPLEMQRVASPFISQAIASLKLYRAIDPDMWGKMIGRVNGVGFAGLYGGTSALGWQSVKLPQGMTWKSYMEFLLGTLPEKTREGYLQKLSVSIKFWREKGGCLAESTIEKLIQAGIPIRVEGRTNYKTIKKPVRMEYLDDIDIPEFRELPTYKRVCICILKNDYYCKYMGFSLNIHERKQKEDILNFITLNYMEEYTSPVYKVRAVPVEKVVANSYNPNVVAPPEMKLLEVSIWEDGFTSPCVCYYIPEEDIYELVDGYHRYMVMKTSKRIYERERGLLPVTVIEKTSPTEWLRPSVITGHVAPTILN